MDTVDGAGGAGAIIYNQAAAVARGGGGGSLPDRAPEVKLSRAQSLLELTKKGARRESVRLVGLMVIVLASFACIGLNVEREFFNIVSLILGLLVKSPIDNSNHYGPQPSSPSPSHSHAQVPASICVNSGGKDDL
jgi:hypothetical protein